MNQTDPGHGTITSLRVLDVRFPTSRELDGSDAMNPDPDYSAAYVILRTDAPSALSGHGFVFTIGRGNDIMVTAVAALRRHVVGKSVAAIHRSCCRCRFSRVPIAMRVSLVRKNRFWRMWRLICSRIALSEIMSWSILMS